MGWVVQQAGGRASTGAGAMLDQEVSLTTITCVYLLNVSHSVDPPAFAVLMAAELSSVLFDAYNQKSDGRSISRWSLSVFFFFPAVLSILGHRKAITLLLYFISNMFELPIQQY